MIQKPTRPIAGIDDYLAMFHDGQAIAERLLETVADMQNFCRPMRRNYRTRDDYRHATLEHNHRVNSLRRIATELHALARHAAKQERPNNK